MKESIIQEVSLLMSFMIRKIKSKKSIEKQHREKYKLIKKYKLTDLEIQELSEYLTWLNNQEVNQ